MTICSLCKQEQSNDFNIGCLCSAFVNKNGELIPRIPYFVQVESRKKLKNLNCPDCNTNPSCFHHKNCSKEICPNCGKYFNKCNCQLDYMEIGLNKSQK